MSITFTRTREQVRVMVLQHLGVIAAGETPSAADSALVYEAIDLRLKELHRLGIFWRKVDKVPLSFTLTANVATASASVDILFPISMHVVDGSLDQPVQIMSVLEYAAIEDKAETGLPTKALWKGSAEWAFWPVPTANTTAKLTYEKIADDTASSTAPDVEVSMMRWLRDMVAYDLASTFGKSDQTILRMMGESEKAERNIRKLAAQRTDYRPVAVDDFRPFKTRTESDYGM